MNEVEIFETAQTFDVCAVGNAIVDVIAEAEDNFLKTHGIVKGAMTLIDAERAAFLYDHIGPAIEMSGGSAANTVAGIASLGGKPAFIGKVAPDQLGAIFRHDLRASGVHFATTPFVGTVPTARSLIVVTQDAQRSMSTYLGACTELTEADIEPDIITSAKVTYLEGFLFDKPTAQAAFLKAAEMAHGAGAKVSLSLSDVFCVERHREAFLRLIEGQIDILFANELELLALYPGETFEAAFAKARAKVETVVITRGPNGAILARAAQQVSIAAFPVEKVVDTTGAGDLFAAGFLFGYTHGLGLETSGKLGAMAAGEIISHYGPRPQSSLRQLAQNNGLLA